MAKTWSTENHKVMDQLWAAFSPVEGEPGTTEKYYKISVFAGKKPPVLDPETREWRTRYDKDVLSDSEVVYTGRMSSMDEPFKGYPLIKLSPNWQEEEPGLYVRVPDYFKDIISGIRAQKLAGFPGFQFTVPVTSEKDKEDVEVVVRTLEKMKKNVKVVKFRNRENHREVYYRLGITWSEYPDKLESIDGDDL